MRVTLGGGEIERFRPMGYDQWFRIFLPLGGDEGLERLPAKANKMFGYLKYLRIPDGIRPVMRNYSVRAFRPATDGPGCRARRRLRAARLGRRRHRGPRVALGRDVRARRERRDHRRGPRLQPGARHRPRAARRRRDRSSRDRRHLRVAPVRRLRPRDHRGAGRRRRPRVRRTRPASRCAGSCASTTTSPASPRSRRCAR